MAELIPIAPPCSPCKCCGAKSPLFGVTDFEQYCMGPNSPPVQRSGVPIYYHRCSDCGFLFTTAFDAWEPADFARHIYNDDYLRVDPDFVESRPRQNALSVSQTFSGTPNLRILDYGGGNGTLAKQLGEHGFPNVDTYDPFVPAYAAHPGKKYECIVSFEVMEHSPQPQATLAEMESLLEPEGMILFSTMTQPTNFDALGMYWWYVGPRNGHVSLYSRVALEHLGASVGLRYGWATEGLHIYFRGIPEFARHLFGK
jgi:SAM-dependent methyltransferase